MNTEQDVINSDWERFASLSQLINHWQRPGWEPGKRVYFWYLTFGDNIELRDITLDCQAKLAAPYLDAIDPADLHMTLDPIALETDLNDEDVRLVESCAEIVCGSIPPFKIAVGPLAGSSGAVRFTTTPWEPIVYLQGALRKAVRNTIPQIEFDTGSFNPHIGIAYCNSAMPAKELIQSVHSVRDLPRVTVSVDSGSLVLLERLDRSWKWTTKRSFRLAGVESKI